MTRNSKLPPFPAGWSQQTRDRIGKLAQELAKRMADHQEEVERMPWKALQAAAMLGDKQAARQVEIMRSNLTLVLIVLFVVGGGAVFGVVGLQFCTREQEIEAEKEAEELRLKGELWKQKQDDAAELRLKYVQSCRVTPEQAEQLYPDPEMP